MRVIIATICTFFFAVHAIVLLGQQRPQYSQYGLNKYQTNLAFGGFDRSLSVTAGIRSQWSQLDGAPRSQYANAHLPLYFLNGSAGLMIESQQIGLLEKVQVAGSFNYIISTDYGLVSVGLRLGGQQVRINNSAVRTPDGNYRDGAVDHGDPILAQGVGQQVHPLWGLGVMYADGPLEVSLSIDQVPDVTASLSGGYYVLSPQYSAYASYLISIDDDIRVRPLALIRSDGAQIQTDIGALGFYKNFIAGVGVRGYSSTSLDAVTITGGAQISEKVRLAYSYDIGISGLRTMHDGTHEFSINYNLNRRINTGDLPPIIYNPRYN